MLKFRKKLAEKKEASKGIAKAGFTLIELLVVIAILAILVLLAAPRFLGYTKDANVASMQADAKVLANSALIYNVENDTQWPVTEEAVDGASEDGSVILTNGATVQVKALDESALKDHVQTLKNDFEDYALVTASADNTYQVGDIVHLEGVEDREGTTHHGVQKTADEVVEEDGE